MKYNLFFKCRARGQNKYFKKYHDARTRVSVNEGINSFAPPRVLFLLEQFKNSRCFFSPKKTKHECSCCSKTHTEQLFLAPCRIEKFLYTKRYCFFFLKNSTNSFLIIFIRYIWQCGIFFSIKVFDSTSNILYI